MKHYWMEIVVLIMMGISMWLLMIALLPYPQQIIYDCKNINYPIAVDIPQEVIKKCRELKK